IRERRLSTHSSCSSASPSLTRSFSATRTTTSWSINCHPRRLARRAAISPPPLPYSREMVTALIRLMVSLASFIICPSCGIFRIFCRREEDENGQVLGDRVKAVLNVCLHKHHRPGFDRPAFVVYLDGSTPADDVVDFIFSVWFLLIDGSC